MAPTVVILAGGIGKSFSPISVNKTILPIFGKPLLQHVIEMVESAGFDNALIVTNSENEKWLSTYQPFNITLRTQLVEPTGMGDALLQAETEIGTKPCLVINATDMIEPIFLKTLLRQTLESSFFITGLKVDNYFPGGYLKMSGSRATEIVEKPGKGNEPSDLMNLVFHYFSDPSVIFNALRKFPVSDDQYEKALTHIMREVPVDVVKYTGKWQKIKYPFHVLNMMDTFFKIKQSNHRARSAYISPQAILEGNVIVDEDAHIDHFAIIKGPAYIGRGVKIGNHTLVRQSSIEESSVVGFGSEVARSYIGPRCKLHHNFVGDSVLESDINPSWGTTFANWRIDGADINLKLPDGVINTNQKKFGAVVARDAFLGVNCSVMPGVTIGKGTKVYPDKLIASSLGENEILK